MVSYGFYIFFGKGRLEVPPKDNPRGRTMKHDRDGHSETLMPPSPGPLRTHRVHMGDPREASPKSEPNPFCLIRKRS